MEIPEPTRPSLTGYVQPGKLLPWSWVNERMTHSRNYWITTRADTFPSSRPVWGIWHDAQLLFSTGSQIAENIRRDARIQVNLESADELVIIEGVVVGIDASQLPFWLENYNQKYNWDMPESIDGVYRVNPRRVLAWICDPSGMDGGVLFSNTATQWVFQPST
ncbi:MAG: hypothetical protein QGI68_12155 [Pseudomonadales bacterium]|nr:hypothetical protein [Pseudomonadales bacterium]MDP7596304.1 hypothetical protein [Pseudomonadales bacterium]HJN52617.1 hypothetical protein [Pseudomonadales bacterium]